MDHPSTTGLHDLFVACQVVLVMYIAEILFTTCYKQSIVECHHLFSGLNQKAIVMTGSQFGLAVDEKCFSVNVVTHCGYCRGLSNWT